MKQEQHRSTTRVIDILEYLSSSNTKHTLTDLASVLNAPKSSLFPIVHTLEMRKYIQLDKFTGQYSIGINAYLLGNGYSAEHTDLDLIRVIMKNTVNVCQETCQLGVLEGTDVLYLVKVDSSQPIRLISKVGTRLPANATAIGKSILSDYDDNEVRRLFSGELQRLTDNTIIDIEEFLRQLEIVRQVGIAEEQEETAEQLCCFAVPLQRRNQVVAGLSVSVPLFRCTSEKKQCVKKELLRAKNEIERIAATDDFSLF